MYHLSSTGSPDEDDLVRHSRVAVWLKYRLEKLEDSEELRPGSFCCHIKNMLPVNPVRIASFVLVSVLLLCAFVWMHRKNSSLSSNVLLTRAEVSDANAGVHTAQGVVRQVVEIRLGQQKLRHTIYRNSQDVNSSKSVQDVEDRPDLKECLARADISLDNPLSAKSYRLWHDTLHVHEDQVHRVDGNFLVLTTTAQSGLIAAESLTVRNEDFHPVRRSVSFRNRETVEIAELDYSVLPWNSELKNMFQNSKETNAESMTYVEGRHIALPHDFPSEEQLDETELSVRLVLSHMHADTGEQIDVVRARDGIEVRGVTESAKRKRELASELQGIPHVSVTISCVEELKAKPSLQGDITGMKIVEMQTRTTPIESYFLKNKRNVATVEELERQIFDAAFSIHLESKTMDDLQRRFGSEEKMSPIAEAMLADLIYTHKHRLLEAIENEKRLLAVTNIQTAKANDFSMIQNTHMTLDAMAEKNFALAKELVLGKGDETRSAEKIVLELYVTADAMNVSTCAVSVAPQNMAKYDKRK